MDDEYFTVNNISTGLYKEKGSKFIAYLMPSNKEIEIESHLLSLRKEHPKARHVCYAYRLGLGSDKFRINDDGEPSGTAGRPIYNELLSANLTDVLLAVVRYFGGTKLGASGLINAYKVSSREAISQNNIVKKYLTKKYRLSFEIENIGKVYNSLKQSNINIKEQNVDMISTIDVCLRLSKAKEKINEFISHFHGLSVNHISHESFVSKIRIKEI